MTAANKPEPLAICTREFNGERSELRVTRDEYEGRRFTRLQLCTAGPHGVFPTAKQVTVRDRELDAVIAALVKSRELAALERGPEKPAEPVREPAWLDSWKQRQERRGR